MRVNGVKWIKDQQGQHFCHCGCGGEIKVQIHHHVRGVPRFLNHHAVKVETHPLRNRYGSLNGRWTGGNYVRGSEQAARFQQERRIETRDANNTYQREYSKRPERKLKNAAKQRDRRMKNPEEHRRASRAYRQADPLRANQRLKDIRVRLRLAMLRAYGHVCECCGETAEEFLTLAHLNGDGAADRKQNGQYGVLRRLRDRGWPKDAGYALQCANCNWATRYGSICPHRKTVLELVA